MGGRRVKVDKPEEVEKPKPQEPKKEEAKSVKEKKVRGKKYLAASAKREAKEYPLTEAIAKVKELSIASFDASVDAHVNLELEKSDQQIRAFVSLPHGTGKSLKVLVFAEGKEAKEAQAAGADALGDAATIEEITKSGRVEFDAIVAIPSFMPKLAAIARILGPKGLMPTPKNGTVSDNPAKVVEELKKGRVELKTEVKPVIHVSIGRVSFPDEHLVANFRVVIGELKNNRAKIKSAYLAPTMGPSVRIALDSIV